MPAPMQNVISEYKLVKTKVKKVWRNFRNEPVTN